MAQHRNYQLARLNCRRTISDADKSLPIQSVCLQFADCISGDSLSGSREASCLKTAAIDYRSIDAGHGGYDRGGIPGQRVAEKEMTLDVAQRLKKVLAASGYRVVMTRDSDVFVPLGTRVAIANSYANAIFVSVHFNSAKRSGASGIEPIFTTGRASR